MQSGAHQTLPEALKEAVDAVFSACVEPAGLVFEAPACLSLLEAAELANVPGLQLASSCRNGTCRTCICQLRSGEVTYNIEWPGLSFEEKREGFILPCVAHPASNLVMQLP